MAPNGGIDACLSALARLNILSQTQGSSNCGASGAACFGPFCEVVGAPFFPPAGDVLKWSAVFSPGATFPTYVNRLGIALHLFVFPISWYDAAIRGAAKGLWGGALDVSFKLENYTMSHLMRMVVFCQLSSQMSVFPYIFHPFIFFVIRPTTYHSAILFGCAPGR